MNIYVITSQSQQWNIDGDRSGADFASVEYAYLDGEKAGKMLKKLNKSKMNETWDTSYDIHCLDIEDCKDSFQLAVAAGMYKV